MNSRKQPSTYAIGEANVETLRAWIRRTRVENVPTNQYGNASRSAILRELNISYSSAHTNSRMTELFESLDKRIHAAPKAAPAAKADVPGDSEQHSYCIELNRENLRLKAEVRRLRWSDDTGRSTDE